MTEHPEAPEPEGDDFDRYCEEHGIQPGEEPAAFAAWLHEQTGWDGPMQEAPADEREDPPTTTA